VTEEKKERQLHLGQMAKSNPRNRILCVAEEKSSHQRTIVGLRKSSAKLLTAFSQMSHGKKNRTCTRTIPHDNKPCSIAVDANFPGSFPFWPKMYYISALSNFDLTNTLFACEPSGTDDNSVDEEKNILVASVE
jgi:hypothetical protein